MTNSEDFEPFDWDFNKDGLYIFKTKPIQREKNCIDKALKKILGKDWNKTIKTSRATFGVKKRKK